MDVTNLLFLRRGSFPFRRGYESRFGRYRICDRPPVDGRRVGIDFRIGSKISAFAVLSVSLLCLPLLLFFQFLFCTKVHRTVIITVLTDTSSPQTAYVNARVCPNLVGVFPFLCVPCAYRVGGKNKQRKCIKITFTYSQVFTKSRKCRRYSAGTCG